MRARHIARGVAGLVLALGLVACAKPGERIKFDGNYYPTKAKKDGDGIESFVVTVSRIDQGLNGARAAGRYGGTEYCIKNFGDSTIAWSTGPESDLGLIQTDSGKLVMRGTCNKW